jgi:hypothetical protein
MPSAFKVGARVGTGSCWPPVVETASSNWGQNHHHVEDLCRSRISFTLARLPGGIAPTHRRQLGRADDFLAVEGDDHVAGADARAVGSAVRSARADEGAAGTVEPKLRHLLALAQSPTCTPNWPRLTLPVDWIWRTAFIATSIRDREADPM